MTKRWGIDLDGVVADFNTAMYSLVPEVTGRDLFGPGDPEPPSWSRHMREVGYTTKEVDAVWKAVATDRSFWLSFEPLPGLDDLNAALPDHLDDEFYFITARIGETTKEQTERWLFERTGLFNPTVIRSKKKGAIANGLALDAFIDDKLAYALDVRVESPTTRVYLLDRPYNAEKPIDGITRVKTVADMFHIEDELQERQERAILE